MAALLRNPRYRRSARASNAFAGTLRNPRFVRDMAYGGDGQFTNPENDPITLDNMPYQARLRIFEERSGHLVRECWSAADGTWIVRYLNRNYTYLVVCYNGRYPALAYNHQTPYPMT